MMKCWAEKPDKRPTFETLRQDLDDFEISMQDEWNIWEDEILVLNNRQTRSNKPMEKKRDNAIQSRLKKSKPKRK